MLMAASHQIPEPDISMGWRSQSMYILYNFLKCILLNFHFTAEQCLNLFGVNYFVYHTFRYIFIESRTFIQNLRGILTPRSLFLFWISAVCKVAQNKTEVNFSVVTENFFERFPLCVPIKLLVKCCVVVSMWVSKIDKISKWSVDVATLRKT